MDYDFFRSILFLFLKYLKNLFLEGKGGRKRGRETSMCGCLLHTHYWGPGLQSRHVPWLGMEPMTLCFPGWHSVTEPHQPGLDYDFNVLERNTICHC